MGKSFNFLLSMLLLLGIEFTPFLCCAGKTLGHSR